LTYNWNFDVVVDDNIGYYVHRHYLFGYYVRFDYFDVVINFVVVDDDNYGLMYFFDFDFGVCSY